MKNKAQLIIYPDSFGKNLKELRLVLKKHFKNVFGGLHILPFYPSSADRGFAPLTHLEVDPVFGDWKDIRLLAKEHDLITDLMVNHISAKSVYFQDYLKLGEKSNYADFFITNDKFSRRIMPRRKSTPRFLKFAEKIANELRDYDKLFHSSGVNKLSLKKIYRPRPDSPFIPFKFNNGETEQIWCTFTDQQIDLDVFNEDVRKLMEKSIAKMSANGVATIRLDAVGYAVKKRGTSSFMIPETLGFIRWLAKICSENSTSSLPELHSYHSFQSQIAKIKEVDYVYDFQIPFLVLQAIYEKDNRGIAEWLKIRPKETVNVLDTHDGIPVVDIHGLLTDQQIASTSTRILENGGNEAKRATGNNGADNVDTYQINCTYYSALREEDDSYIVARAIQLFIPGIPQVYYVGLLAGRNDVLKFEKSNVGRDVNRHDYTIEEIEQDLGRDVVQRLLKLIKFRNELPVFDGKFSFEIPKKEILLLKWEDGNMFLEVNVNLETKKVTADCSDKKSQKRVRKVF